MNTRAAPTAESLAAELDALATEFAVARRTKRYRQQPFPLEILERAYELDAAAPALKVLRRLHLNADKVRARMRVAGAATRAATMERRSQGRPKKAMPPRTSFVEIPLAAAVMARPVTVTIDRGEGLRITLEIASDRAASAVGLIASLIGGAA